MRRKKPWKLREIILTVLSFLLSATLLVLLRPVLQQSPHQLKKRKIIVGIGYDRPETRNNACIHPSSTSITPFFYSSQSSLASPHSSLRESQLKNSACTRSASGQLSPISLSDIRRIPANHSLLTLPKHRAQTMSYNCDSNSSYQVSPSLNSFPIGTS